MFSPMSGCAESGWFLCCGIMLEQVAFIYLIGNLKKKHNMSVSRHSLGHVILEMEWAKLEFTQIRM